MPCSLKLCSALWKCSLESNNAIERSSAFNIAVCPSLVTMYVSENADVSFVNFLRF